jgi:large subunit ribosomal protein L15
MRLNQIQPKNKLKSPKRVGRGESSCGKTSGRGNKGQKSRSGFKISNRFEGGQTPLSLRLPKNRGFKSHKAKIVAVKYALLVEKFKSSDLISPASLLEKGVIKDKVKIVKILGPIEEKINFKFKNCIFTKTTQLKSNKKPSNKEE